MIIVTYKSVLLKHQAGVLWPDTITNEELGLRTGLALARTVFGKRQ